MKEDVEMEDEKYRIIVEATAVGTYEMKINRHVL
jgi:hypothetical protein